MAEALSRVVPDSNRRMILSIRHEHVIIFNRYHLKRILTSYFSYYTRSRTHLAPEKDCPQPRPAQIMGRLLESLRLVDCTVGMFAMPPEYPARIAFWRTTGQK